jgi:RNA polymerase sigma-70 factor (ECF subfamily)
LGTREAERAIVWDDDPAFLARWSLETPDSLKVLVPSDTFIPFLEYVAGVHLLRLKGGWSLHQPQRKLFSSQRICWERETGPFALLNTGTQHLLREFLQANTAPLLGTIRSYVQRMGLASGDSVPEVALEILQETTIEALAHADRFNPQTQPMAWLLGIAMNMIRRERVAAAKRSQREELLGQLARRYPDIPDENDLLDSLVPPSNSELAQILESDEQVEVWLALVPGEDQHVLRLALLDGYEHRDLAHELGTSPGAARMRLHRALSRLRTAWKAQQDNLQKGAGNA